MTSEPIAIIGIGCRFPGGANSPEAFWRMLRNGVDAISDTPPERWSLAELFDPTPGTPGKLYVRRAGFIDEPALFDAHFFGISPREAARMDPQQRLLLEVAHEAMEDAGVPPETLAGTATGVFVGISTYEYGTLQSQNSEINLIDGYTNMGGALSIAANRLSYLYNLNGPSMAVDTACSSSLVATHLACESIWRRESTAALVGGVNLMVSPLGSLGFCKASMLSPDGRCKSFDESANGYVRAEGAGIVLLKPLAAALRDGNTPYAVILGSSVNQDGRSSSIAVPNRIAQEAMLRDVYTKLGIDPAHVRYVEAHGTGTPVGDPIEANALGAVLGAGREDGDACVIGSVKSNIGHLEAGAGVAGLIKAALCLHHGEIPPNLHFRTPNPLIAFESLKLRVPTALEPFPGGNGRRIAGVNSFGFGGTNAHVVLEGAPPVAVLPAAAEGPLPALLPLSGRSAQAVQALAAKYLEALSDGGSLSGESVRDVCANASLRRPHYDQRLTIVAGDDAEMRGSLENYLAGAPRASSSVGRVLASQRARLAMVFSGMGPQWWRMGRDLLTDEPVYRRAVRECDELFRQHAGWSLVEELTADQARSRIDETAIAQPAIFATQVGLAALWRSWGVEPEAVVGHSVGEVAAAYVAGALSLEDAVLLVYHRSRLQQTTAGQGGMLAVRVPQEHAERLVAPYEGRVSVAAVNSPSSVTLSGDQECLNRIAVEELENDQARCRFLKVEVPYHSPVMDRIREQLFESLAGLSPKRATIPLLSTALGSAIDGSELGAAYWWKNVRNPVYFAAAMAELAGSGHNQFLEVGSHPVLGASIAECVAAVGAEGLAVPSLRRGEPERATMLGSLGKLYTRGYPVDWSRQYANPGRRLKLPLYPWQKEAFWNESDESRKNRLGETDHPLLGRRQGTPTPTWSCDLGRHGLGYLTDHRIGETAVYPAAGHIEMGLAAARALFGDVPVALENVEVLKALPLLTRETMKLQIAVNGEHSSFEIHSFTGSTWTQHVKGDLSRWPDKHRTASIDRASILSRCPNDVALDALYAFCNESGLVYGPAFRGIKQVHVGEREAIAEIQSAIPVDAEVAQYSLHPTVLDSCFQTTMAIALREPEESDAQPLYLPVQVDKVRLYVGATQKLWCHTRVVERGLNHLKIDYVLFDDNGSVLAEIQGQRTQPVGRGAESRPESLDSHLYKYQWRLTARAGRTRPALRRGDIPAPDAIADRVAPFTQATAAQLERGRHYRDVRPAMDDLCLAFVASAFGALGWAPLIGERVSGDALGRRLGIGSRRRALFLQLLRTLANASVLRDDGDVWEVLRWPRTDPHALWRVLLQRYPGYLAELTLLERLGRHLHMILRGDVELKLVLFPTGTAADAEHLLQDAPTSRIYNLLVHETVRIVLAGLPPERKVRVLELGGGASGVTSFVLSQLPRDRCEYVFTDPAERVVDAAVHRFRGLGCFSARTLDPLVDPLEQGLDERSFDLVLAAPGAGSPVEHQRALEYARRLVADGGLLMLTASRRHSASLDLTLGLYRGCHLLTPGEWAAHLRAVGFESVVDIVDGDGAEQALIVAQAPLSLDPPHERPIDHPPGTWLVLKDRSGIGSRIAGVLREWSQRAILVTPGESYEWLDDESATIRPDDPNDLSALVGDVVERHPELKGVLHLWALDALPHPETTLDSLATAEVLGSHALLHLSQALASGEWNVAPDLWVVTRGTEAVGGSAIHSVEMSSMWGLRRVIGNEFRRLRSRIVDLGPEPSADEIGSLCEELFAAGEDDEIALRGRLRYVHRFGRTSMTEIAGHGQPAGEGAQPTPCRLEVMSPGMLESLTITPVGRTQPARGQVEIEVRAAALNFKDIAKAMGLLTDETLEGTGSGRGLGLECAGTVAALGADVSHLRVGDPVIAFAANSLGTYALADARFVAAKPDDLSFEAAATLLTVSMTAHYALNHLARIGKGERVLIHAGAGGVGLAAIQLAQRAGAEVFASAGSPDKRAFLRAIGVAHVVDSRSVGFADDVMRITGGEGVDVVLNSLGGEMLPKSLSVLRPYGRFIELGKRDIQQNARLGLRPFQNNLSFFAVDMDRMSVDRPALSARVHEEVLGLLGNGDLHPLPHRVFPVWDSVNAFRFMAQARHVGKVVISFENLDTVAPPSSEGVSFRADRTYLVTGGLSGFGLATAQWLARHGAGHLLLMSRSGASTGEARLAVETLRASGTVVVVAQGDVTAVEQVEGVLQQVRDSMPPLAGVFHAAMVIDDGLLPQLTAERMRRVMAPKVQGAWLLHRCTLDWPLDYFVLFSSVSSLLGNPGQGNYSAANAFLDSLAQYRRQTGLAGLAVNWGALGETGYVARNEAVAEHLERAGVRTLQPARALEALGQLLRHGAVQAAVMLADWQRWLQLAPSVQLPRFSPLLREMTSVVGADGRPEDRGFRIAEILGAPAAERRMLIETHLSEILAGILGTTASKVDREQPLMDSGIDSLMVVELITGIHSTLGVEVPATKLMEGVTLAGMALFVAEELTKVHALSDRGDESTPPGASPKPESQSVPSVGALV